MIKDRKKKGFTLIETIIYIALVSVLSTIVIESLLYTVKDFYAVRLSRELNQSMTVAMERLYYEMRNSYDVDVSRTTFDANIGRLTLLKHDPVTNTNTSVEFYVTPENGLAVREGGVEKGTLTSSRITATSFRVRDLTVNQYPHTIKVEITLTATNAQGETSHVDANPVVAIRGTVH